MEAEEKLTIVSLMKSITSFVVIDSREAWSLDQLMKQA